MPDRCRGAAGGLPVGAAALPVAIAPTRNRRDKMRWPLRRARKLDDLQEPASDLPDRVGEAVEVGGLGEIGAGAAELVRINAGMVSRSWSAFRSARISRPVRRGRLRSSTVRRSNTFRE